MEMRRVSRYTPLYTAPAIRYKKNPGPMAVVWANANRSVAHTAATAKPRCEPRSRAAIRSWINTLKNISSAATVASRLTARK